MEDYLKANPDEPEDQRPLTRAQADEKAKEIAARPAVKQLLEEMERVRIYVGASSRLLKEEYLRWLTTRGNGHDYEKGKCKGNRPVLQWKKAKPNGSTTITQKEAEERLGFQGLEVYESLRDANAFAVEAALQRLVQQRFTPGTFHYLWRRVGAGSNGCPYNRMPTDKQRVHIVFITYALLSNKELEELGVAMIK